MDGVESALEAELRKEASLSAEEARLYLELLQRGGIPSKENDGAVQTLLSRGMVILSGDGRKFIPVHPRLGIANQYRTWREAMVREINERRMRVDKLILKLIPLYEAATEKKTGEGGR